MDEGDAVQGEGLEEVHCGLWIVDCGLWIVDCGWRISDCGSLFVDQSVMRLDMDPAEREGQGRWLAEERGEQGLFKGRRCVQGHVVRDGQRAEVVVGCLRITPVPRLA
jgi:hypothetical protein